MKSVPVIEVEEFTQFLVHSETIDGTTRSVFEHPEFGRWDQRQFDLGFGRITEMRNSVTRPLAVRVKDEGLSRKIHHCMCVDGSLGTRFEDGCDADLTPYSYHFLHVPGDTYLMSMDRNFHNLHIELSEEYYRQLLCDSEEWSALLKERLTGDATCVAGSHSLTPAMSQGIYDILNTPMNGMVKRLIIEARMLELIALQWGMSLKAPLKQGRDKNDVIDEVKLFLDQSFLQDHSLRSICMQFGINEFALKSGFKKQFGTTVFDYLISRRLEHARELLVQGGLPVGQVGSIVGYKYSNHFSTAFKNRFGITPTAFAGRIEA